MCKKPEHGWEDIDDFARARKSWLKQFLLLPNGLPGHDVYRRVFVRLIPEQIEACFMEWVRALKPEIAEKEVIAIDGKSIRSTFQSHKGLRAVHLVSAWASERRVTLGQVKVDEKSNEITAIPELLSMIAIKGCIVTIDAMGCQYEIADQIVKADADYVLGLKGNQGTLHEDVKEYFACDKPSDKIQTHTTFDVDHGRYETRNYAVTNDVNWLYDRHPNWKSIKTIGMVHSQREQGGKTSNEIRYFISSLPADPELFAMAARTHWSIENSCHYILDMMFREDASRIKQGEAVENMAWMRKFALALVSMDTTPKLSTRKKLKRIGWSEEYLESLLFQTDFSSLDLPTKITIPKKVV